MKILVIRFSSIGDIVLTSPVVRCLKKQLPDSKIHFLTKKPFTSIIEPNPNVDKVFFLESSLPKVIAELKKEKYDLVVDLHNNLRSLRVKQSLGIKFVAFNKLNLEKWLMTRFKVNKLPDVHIVDRYLETVKHLGVRNDLEGLDYYIGPEDEVNPANISLELERGYITFAIGAQHTTKRLPVEKIISICQKIDKPVVLIGGKTDADAAAQIENGAENIVNTCGKLSVAQSASIIKQADAVITHDTGMMHIAAAFKKKIISVWGNTIPEFGMYPYMPGEGSTLVEVKELSCRPCSKIGHDKCPKGHFMCMREINETQIISSVE